MRIAIPKGRLQERALSVFADAGYDIPSETDLKTRKLVFDRGTQDDAVQWIFVKDCDVPVYVEHGAADAGIAGLDQILEHACTAYQPVELPFGACRMMLIAAPGIRGALVAKRITNGEVPRELRPIVERLISGAATLDDVAQYAPEAAERLAGVRAKLGDEFVLQLDDVDETPGYYTGVRFRVYAGGSRTRVAQGGRYDTLYQRFGTSAAAIGFTFTIDDPD